MPGLQPISLTADCSPFGAIRAFLVWQLLFPAEYPPCDLFRSAFYSHRLIKCPCAEASSFSPAGSSGCPGEFFCARPFFFCYQVYLSRALRVYEAVIGALHGLKQICFVGRSVFLLSA